MVDNQHDVICKLVLGLEKEKSLALSNYVPTRSPITPMKAYTVH